jgi:hypothetical protein
LGLGSTGGPLTTINSACFTHRQGVKSAAGSWLFDNLIYGNKFEPRCIFCSLSGSVKVKVTEAR